MKKFFYARKIYNMLTVSKIDTVIFHEMTSNAPFIYNESTFMSICTLTYVLKYVAHTCFMFKANIFAPARLPTKIKTYEKQQKH